MDSNRTVDQPETGDLTRRQILGYGLAAGGAVALFNGIAGGGSPALAQDPGGVPEVLGAPLPGLTHLGIDAYAFWPDVASQRVYSHLTGSQPVNPNTRIWAPLALPAGSIVMQMSASYQGQPILEISRRPLYESGTAAAPANVFQQTLPAGGGGPTATTINLTLPITIDRNATYTVSAYCAAGASILGVSVGYLGGFVPYRGSNPRVLDTRLAGQGPAFAAGSSRTIALGVPGRIAVFNLTATQTGGAGYLAAYQSGIAWPGNSSVNFSGPGQTVANFAMCAMDASGRIDVRSDVSSSHVIVDLVGSIM